MMKKAIPLLVGLLLTGCSGTLYTVKNPQFDENNKMQGVIFYGYKVVSKPVKLDRIINKVTGEISHSIYHPKDSGKYCAPDVKYLEVPVADYAQKYAMMYEPGLFETNTFGVTLSDGKLASVNTSSTPGPKTAVETLQGIASLREDILNGFAEASKNADERAKSFVLGQTNVPPMIKCTHEK